MKTLVFLGMIAGSYAGSFIPLIWGGSAFSISSIMLGGAGGIFGIWVGFRVAQRIGVE